jgi:hypothetical protein
MTEEPSKTLTYTPTVTVWVKHGQNLESLSVPVPSGQEWLYAMLEQQEKDLNSIKGWMTFFGILTILGVAGYVIIFILSGLSY